MKYREKMKLIKKDQTKYGQILFLSTRQYSRDRDGYLVLLGMYLFIVVLVFITVSLISNIFFGIMAALLPGIVFVILIQQCLKNAPFVLYEKGIRFSNYSIPFMYYHEIIDVHSRTGRHDFQILDLYTKYGGVRRIMNLSARHSGASEIQSRFNTVKHHIIEGIRNTRHLQEHHWDKRIFKLINHKVELFPLRAKVKYSILHYANSRGITNITLAVVVQAVQFEPQNYKSRYCRKFVKAIEEASLSVESVNTHAILKYP